MDKEIVNLREEVFTFAQAMEQELQLHDEVKGSDISVSVATTTIETFLTLAEEEIAELKAALCNQERREARLECADIANYFMMIWHKLASLDVPYGRRETDNDKKG